MHTPRCTRCQAFLAATGGPCVKCTNLAASRPPPGRTVCVECANLADPHRTRCQRCREARKPADWHRRLEIRSALLPPDVREGILAAIARGGHITDVAADWGTTAPQLHGYRSYDPEWGVALDDALMAGRDPDLDHGAHKAYRWGKCRCPECRAAKAVYYRREEVS